MNKLILVAGSCLIFASCSDAPKADKAEATETQQAAVATGTSYQVNTGESKVEWIGSKPTGHHHGTVVIKNGSLSVDNGNISAGKFTLDITTIRPDDQDAEKNEKLRTHLQSGDFFDAQNHPEAVFEITEVKPGVDTTNKDLVMKDATHMVTGNLVLKTVSKSISFPAKIMISDVQVVADANFNIDRTQWGMNYKSDKSLGDKIIDPIVNIKIHLVAGK